MDYMQISRQIRLTGLQKDLTQTQLAEAADLSVPCINRVFVNEPKSIIFNRYMWIEFICTATEVDSSKM